MRYLAHTQQEIQAMLQVTGAASLDGLFSSVPADCLSPEGLDLPEPLTEWELSDQVERLAAQNAIAPKHKIFLGAGSYHHHIPAVIPSLVSRGEFLTAYTPYQPEVSQGTLQAIYEYQTMTARLLGMEVVNASVYDGASALAEALLMAIRVTKKKRVAISAAINPLYRQVVATYLGYGGFEVQELPFGSDGLTQMDGLEKGGDLAAVALQSPNFFGCVEDLAQARQAADQAGCLLVATFSEALAFGLLKNPGEQGADIVAGEGQSLGIPQSFGGPYLGIFAARQKFLRNMPGRLVGQTVDRDGRRGFVITISTREQHIRRERATSNICSNQSLCALTAAMFLASLGGSGLRQLARLNYDKAHYLQTGLAELGIETVFKAPFFNEFVVRIPEGLQGALADLENDNLVLGLPLDGYYPQLEGCRLVCVTETKSKADLDAVLEGLRS